MTLTPPDFSFPSTITTIIKMEVDQRRIDVEGLEFGVVKTNMVLELEVVGTGNVKKLQQWWWVLAVIEGKLVVINGDSGRCSPRVMIAWWLSFNSLFFSGKTQKMKMMMKEKGKSKRWARKPLQNLIGVDMEAWMLLWRKIQRWPCNSISVHRRRHHHCNLFLICNEDSKR